MIHFYFILIYCQQVLTQMQPSSLIEIRWRLKFFGLGILVLLTNINSIVLLSYMGLLSCFCSQGKRQQQCSLLAHVCVAKVILMVTWLDNIRSLWLYYCSLKRLKWVNFVDVLCCLDQWFLLFITEFSQFSNFSLVRDISMLSVKGLQQLLWHLEFFPDFFLVLLHVVLDNFMRLCVCVFQ